jgi:hypothetical protein
MSWIIAADVKRFCHQINTDEVSGGFRYTQAAIRY